MSGLYVLPGVVPVLYDVLVSAGVTSPGVCSLTIGAREFVWDRKTAQGAKGENITFKNQKIVEFQAQFKLIGDDQLEAWEAWIALWDWDPIKQKPTPVDVLHPLLYERGVSLATATKIFPPTQDRKGDNLWTAKLEAIEWAPPPKKNVSGSPANANGGKSAADNANAQRDKQIQGLLAQAQAP